ncbi:synapse differentiation-inducing gene protein 1-like isoform X2 [Sceloporus undulatus]|uniref:synapse differentiation-inducing gene protein 1-like isoform X2 n=1 Tax=Sceloporus undulatus TaxID=8520 RepID=UPI001C4B9190|nr:synapse differentiation-inducing gene protein 1-like isoform X2 [Sceloporus undulatus]
MSNMKYGKLEDNVPAGGVPPNYEESAPLKRPVEPAAPMGYGATPPMPPQGQYPYGPSGSGYYQDPVLQLPQAGIRYVQPTNEPDYLGYSIFTMLCCCLPLGIAALIYSIQTRDANHRGDAASAQRNSRNARILAHTALGVGLVLLIVYIVLMVIMTKKIHEQNPPTGQ